MTGATDRAALIGRLLSRVAIGSPRRLLALAGRHRRRRLRRHERRRQDGARSSAGRLSAARLVARQSTGRQPPVRHAALPQPGAPGPWQSIGQSATGGRAWPLQSPSTPPRHDEHARGTPPAAAARGQRRRLLGMAGQPRPTRLWHGAGERRHVARSPSSGRALARSGPEQRTGRCSRVRQSGLLQSGAPSRHQSMGECPRLLRSRAASGPKADTGTGRRDGAEGKSRREAQPHRCGAWR